MTKKDSKKTTNEPIAITPIKITPTLRIQDYKELDAEAVAIENKYKGFIGTEKQCRQVKRRVNKVRRQLNDVRKAKTKPYRSTLKDFKSLIDNLINHLGVVTKAMNKQIKIYKQQDQKKLLSKFQPAWDEICRARHLPQSPTPKDILKKASYTKKQRINILAGCALTIAQREEFQNARVFHGKAINVTQAGEIKFIPHAKVKHFTFIGTPLQYDALQKFIKENHINMHETKD